MALDNVEVEIIDLDDNLQNGLHKSLSDGYSSDQSLPDLPAIRKPALSTFLSVENSGRKTTKHLKEVPPRRCQSIVIDDDVSISEPKTYLIPSNSTSQQLDSQSVIDILSSSSQEIEREPQEQELIKNYSLPLKKSHSISLPVDQTYNEPGPIPRLPSKILDKLDNLLDRKRKIFSALSETDTALANPKDSHKNGGSLSDVEDSQTIISSQEKSQKKTKRIPSASRLEKAQKQVEKQIAKELKAQEKERKMVEKRIAQSIAAVNVLKKSKKDSAPEMIVEVCASINKTALHTHITSFMEALGCEYKLSTMAVTGLVRLRRKITAKFDPEKGYWMPLTSPVIEDEDRLIVIVKAQDYLQIIRTSIGLQHHVDSIRRIKPSAIVLYIIEGLASLVRKSKSLKNRAYQAAVRASGITTEEGIVNRPGPANQIDQLVDEETVEDSLLDLQIQHRCLIVHSTSPADTAENLSVLVSDISTIPYKNERNSAAQFCTESGQIKTGSDDRDTFEKLLQAVSRVTPQIAQAIATKFGNVHALYSALAANGTACIENIPKGHNADGTVTTTALGIATAQKVFRAFMSEDALAEA